MSDDNMSDTCFVVSPIGQAGSEQRKHADWVFHGIIKPVFAAVYPNFKVERSDHITEPGQINAQVIDRLHNARIVIADLSYLNANVFYEVGIRHMAERPIIHMQRIGEDIPFDVSIYRAIKFSLQEFDQIEVAKKQLSGMLVDVLRPDYAISNPVTEARGRLKLHESATPGQQIVLEDIAFLKSKIGALEELLTFQMGVDSAISSSARLKMRHGFGKSNKLDSLADLYHNFDPDKANYRTMTVNVGNSSPNRVNRVLELIQGFIGRSTSMTLGADSEKIEVAGPDHELKSLVALIDGLDILSGMEIIVK